MTSPPSHNHAQNGEEVEQDCAHPFPTPRQDQAAQNNPGGDQMNRQGQEGLPEPQMLVKDVQGKKAEKDGKEDA